MLAALHAVDPEAVGLGEFGRPQGFLERQVRRWGKQLEGSKTREHPDADELHRLLTERLPAEDPSVVGIVHGDYRLDNCLVGADDQIHAVVDWEMATLGDTRTDVALMLVYETLGASAGGDLVSDVAKAPGLAGQRAAARGVHRGQRPASPATWASTWRWPTSSSPSSSRGSTTATSRARPSARGSTGSARAST